MYKQGHAYTTHKGLQMSLAAHNGQPLNITRITVGDGIHPPDTDPVLVESLISPRMNARNLFNAISGDNTLLRIHAIIDGVGVTEGFPVRETGVYATAGGEEILFAVLFTPDKPDYVWPESAGAGNLTNIDVNIRVVSTDDVVVVPGSEPYVTASYFDEVIASLQDKLDDVQKVANATGRRVIATRIRDPSKKDYGLGDSNDKISAALLAVPYTGTAEASITVDGKEYDVNMSTSGANAPDGTMIIRKVED